MKNKLLDLNNHLFAQLERLSDENISEEDLTKEIKRSKSITDVAKTAVDNAKLALDAEKFRREFRRVGVDDALPEMLESKRDV